MSTFQLSAPELGRLLGVTGRTVLRLHANGVLPREGKRFDPFRCVPAYLDYIKNDREASGDLAAAKLKLIDAQRKAVEHKNAIAERRVIQIADVEVVLERVGVLIGSQLDGLAGRVAGQVASEADPAICRRIIFDECRRIRNAAAGELEALAGCAPHGEGAVGAADEDT
jgi:hypothetical protein